MHTAAFPNGADLLVACNIIVVVVGLVVVPIRELPEIFRHTKPMQHRNSLLRLVVARHHGSLTIWWIASFHQLADHFDVCQGALPWAQHARKLHWVDVNWPGRAGTMPFWSFPPTFFPKG